MLKLCLFSPHNFNAFINLISSQDFDLWCSIFQLFISYYGWPNHDFFSYGIEIVFRRCRCGFTVAMSIEAVASSIIRMLLLRTKARARQKSCLCPKLKFSPASVTTASRERHTYMMLYSCSDQISLLNKTECFGRHEKVREPQHFITIENVHSVSKSWGDWHHGVSRSW